MDTLLDFIFETTQNSYIVAVVLLVASIPFWRFLAAGDDKEKRRK